VDWRGGGWDFRRRDTWPGGRRAGFNGRIPELISSFRAAIFSARTTGDSNLYRYVTDGPTNATDPNGLWTQDELVSILKQTTIGKQILKLIADSEKEKKLTIYKVDDILMHYRERKTKTDPWSPYKEVSTKLRGITESRFNPKRGDLQYSKIYLSSKLTPVEAAMTLVHELSHFVDDKNATFTPEGFRVSPGLVTKEGKAILAELSFLMQLPAQTITNKMNYPTIPTIPTFLSKEVKQVAYSSIVASNYQINPGGLAGTGSSIASLAAGLTIADKANYVINSAAIPPYVIRYYVEGKPLNPALKQYMENKGGGLAYEFKGSSQLSDWADYLK
jgi:hypothetical protein